MEQGMVVDLESQTDRRPDSETPGIFKNAIRPVTVKVNIYRGNGLGLKY